jgi:hypothetical protein
VAVATVAVISIGIAGHMLRCFHITLTLLSLTRPAAAHRRFAGERRAERTWGRRSGELVANRVPVCEYLVHISRGTTNRTLAARRRALRGP